MGVNVIDHGTTSTSRGPFLQLDKLAKYSAKYHAMMDLVLKLMRTDTGKIMVFHPRVHSSGVLLIQEIFRQNSSHRQERQPGRLDALLHMRSAQEGARTEDWQRAGMAATGR